VSSKQKGKASKAVCLQDVIDRHDIQVYIRKADSNMEKIGYTEHGFRHCGLVAERAKRLIEQLGHDGRTGELAAIAGYLHDIGNCVSRYGHAQAAAMIAYHVLMDLGMPPEETAEILAAVGNHEEEYGEPFGIVAAAVIIADKSDVARSRVRSIHPARFDEHDQINYAAMNSALTADPREHLITLSLDIDTSIGSIMQYFELFLTRMVMSRRAAETLGCHFSLIINGTKLL
jgi:metal-dependent HD superfamily phosphatase/phosphodiesterase